ncbi:MAG: LytTR family transcriptional regulator DNA-binding domain-containing protein [Saprospirales bacterium]|nr:LytTR family transcriptional regulator DNA-binding domain-containing protein [Saprospirales bacterium]
MGLSCLILEDALHGGQLLSSILYKLEGVESVEVVQDLGRVPDLFQEGHAEVVFWVAESISESAEVYWNDLPRRPALVLHSAHAELALAAFRLGAIDFLPDPVQLEDLQRALQRAAEWSAFHTWKNMGGTGSDSIPKRPYFFVKSDYRIVRIPLDEILFIEALGEYIRITTADQKVVTLYSLSKLGDWLPPRNFIRIHRSYIINLDKVNFIQNNVVSLGPYQLPISKNQRKSVLDAVQGYGLL